MGRTEPIRLFDYLPPSGPRAGAAAGALKAADPRGLSGSHAQLIRDSFRREFVPGTHFVVFLNRCPLVNR